MTNKDYEAASMALVEWLMSQDIEPEDAVRVLTATLVGTIALIAKRAGLEAEVGGKIVADMIVDSLK